MTARLWIALALCSMLAAPARLDARSYRIVVKRIDRNVYQAMASKVIIETRVCGDLTLAEEPEEAVLNWEGPYGDNWLRFTASRIRCDVATIR
jgi:hypothetical protein